MRENGEIYTAGKNFTLLPGLTGWTNSTSEILELRCLTKTHLILLVPSVCLTGNVAKSLLPEIVLEGPLLLQGVLVCVSVEVLIGHNDDSALLHSVCLSLLDGRRDR